MWPQDQSVLSIRKARSTDLAAVHAIEEAAFPDPWNPDVLMECLVNFPSTFLVAETDGKIAGFITGGIEDTGEVLYGHICNLAVDKDLRRMGIGRHLVRKEERQFVVLFAEGVQLEVRASNTAAQRFYRALGYRQVMRVDKYYANGEDAILMMKWFRF